MHASQDAPAKQPEIGATRNKYSYRPLVTVVPAGVLARMQVLLHDVRLRVCCFLRVGEDIYRIYPI